MCDLGCQPAVAFCGVVTALLLSDYLDQAGYSWRLTSPRLPLPLALLLLLLGNTLNNFGHRNALFVLKLAAHNLDAHWHTLHQIGVDYHILVRIFLSNDNFYV